MVNKIIIAHRGASKLARENTLEAFQKAIDLGADMIEFDIRQTKDGHIIVLHDPKIGNLSVKKAGYKELERQANARGFHLPTLNETLALAQNKIKLDIEFKESGFEEVALGEILRYFKPRDFIVSSFKESVLKKIKKLNPEVRLALIIGGYSLAEYRKIVKQMLLGKRLMRDYYGMVVPWQLYKLKIFQIQKYFNKKLYVYTADGAGLIKKLINSPRVSGIITNRPDLALKLRNGNN